jgi:cytochrome c oxidase subunit 4
MNPATNLSVRGYILVFAALLVLTATTTGVAFVDLGATWNTTVALAIAVIKALLVILFFMHVLHSRPMTWIFVGAGFFWLLILFTFTLADYATRIDFAAPPRAGLPLAGRGEPGPAPGMRPANPNK